MDNFVIPSPEISINRFAIVTTQRASLKNSSFILASVRNKKINKMPGCLILSFGSARVPGYKINLSIQRISLQNKHRKIVMKKTGTND